MPNNAIVLLAQSRIVLPIQCIQSIASAINIPQFRFVISVAPEVAVPNQMFYI